MKAADISSFGCKFSVIAAPKHLEMFMMNMQVYDVMPLPIASDNSEQPVSVVWCAVFNVKGAHRPN